MQRLGPLFLAALLTGAQASAQAASGAMPGAASADVDARFADAFGGLALAPAEREACLALALRVAMHGDGAAGLAWLGRARAGSPEDALGERLALEQARLEAWLALREAYLSEVVTSGKPLTLELQGKRVTSPVTREGDELVLLKARGRRVALAALPAEDLLANMPKERFEGPLEWLKIYPYCVTANPKWKRLTTTSEEASALRRDAEAFYPRLAALGPVVEALDALARRAPPADAAGAREALAELERLLALGRDEEILRARLAALGNLARALLEAIAASLGVPELTHATVSEPAEGVLRLAYDFTRPEEALDWRADDAYLAELRTALDPVTATSVAGAFAPGPQGFAGNGARCWSHVLEFEVPLRLSYRLRWDPTEGQPNQVFAFALGLGDAAERHLRVSELGFLYVDERDGRYLAVRPRGDAVVQLGQTYALELVHDGQRVSVSIDGVARSEGAARTRSEGRVFLWVHSDLRVAVPSLALEGRVVPASLARLRAGWVQDELARLGLAEER